MSSTRTCAHVLANGKICQGPALRDSNLCYWHHKARHRRRHCERISGPAGGSASPGIVLPVLEDGNAIQVSLQEVLHALLDGRLDSRRAGLLLYGLQVATSNLRRLDIKPWHSEEQIASIGDDEELGNDELGPDEPDENQDAPDGDQEESGGDKKEADEDQQKPRDDKEKVDDVDEEAITVGAQGGEDTDNLQAPEASQHGDDSDDAERLCTFMTGGSCRIRPPAGGNAPGQSVRREESASGAGERSSLGNLLPGRACR